MIVTCDEINIRTFVKVKFDRQYSLLGYDNDADAIAAFERIETEYNDATGFVPPQLQEINRTNAAVARGKAVQSSCFAMDEALRLLDGEDLEEIIGELLPRLKRQGISLSYNGNIEQFQRAYKSAKIREKSNEIRLKEMLQKSEEEKDVKEYTIDDFYSTLRTVQKFQGFTISEVETNMRNFAGMVRDYRELTRVHNAKGN